ncbi:MAG: WXG100 family type VII secretion target [Roseburia sp.]|nr:WXG100 family type VII secretion target [Roseburia sp.]
MIVFDVEQMKQTSEHIFETFQEIQENMKRIEQIVMDVRGDWQGEAEKAFEKKLLYVKAQFAPVQQFWKEYAVQIREQAELYEEHESEIRSKLNRV